MRGYLECWKARRAAVALITPLVRGTERRHGPIPQIAWHSPYIIGFMTMLISLVVMQRSRGRLTDEQLGLTQLSAWQQIAGLHDDRIGEEIVLLSTEEDADFMGGCSNACRFLSSMQGPISLGDIGQLAGPYGQSFADAAATWWAFSPDPIEAASTVALWEQLFESRLLDQPSIEVWQNT
jgi:hypothetical protein